MLLVLATGCCQHEAVFNLLINGNMLLDPSSEFMNIHEQHVIDLVDDQSANQNSGRNVDSDQSTMVRPTDLGFRPTYSIDTKGLI